MWSVYSRTLNDLPGTSNFAEGWRKEFRRLVSTHPGIYEFINDIKKKKKREKETGTPIKKR